MTITTKVVTRNITGNIFLKDRSYKVSKTNYPFYNTLLIYDTVINDSFRHNIFDLTKLKYWNKRTEKFVSWESAPVKQWNIIYILWSFFLAGVDWVNRSVNSLFFFFFCFSFTHTHTHTHTIDFVIWIFFYMIGRLF